MKTPVCPHCGHPVPVPETFLTGQETIVFKLIEKAGQAGIRRQTLIARSYAHRADGGSSNASGWFTGRFIKGTNKKIASFGLMIETIHVGMEVHYRLVRIVPCE